MMSDKNKETSLLVLQILLGVLFIFSGFIKNSKIHRQLYKINDYLLLSIGGLAEGTPVRRHHTAVGNRGSQWSVCMLLGVRIRVDYHLRADIHGLHDTTHLVFSPIHNPVTDCGCFGDAL